MKHLFITLITAALLLLTGCDIQYGEQLNNYPNKNGATEVVEIEKISSSETDTAALSKFETATVVNVVDADTVDIIKNGNTERIRFILVDAPESQGKYKENPEPYAIEASKFTKSLLLDKKVWIEYDVEKEDQYGRTLAYVWLDEVNYEHDGNEYHDKEVMINELLLKHGYAHVAVYKPNEKYKDRFYEIENEAKQNRVGIWE